jgi:hypothetical protein
MCRAGEQEQLVSIDEMFAMKYQVGGMSLRQKSFKSWVLRFDNELRCARQKTESQKFVIKKQRDVQL